MRKHRPKRSGGNSMTKFVSAAVMALLAVAVATPVNAGYLVVRVILDGSGSGGATGGYPSGGMMSGAGGIKPGTPGGTLGGRQPTPGAPMGGFPMSGFPMQGGPTGESSAYNHDPSRALVV